MHNWYQLLTANRTLTATELSRLAAFLRRRAGVGTILPTRSMRSATASIRANPGLRRAVLSEARAAIALKANLFGRDFDLADIARRHGVPGRCGLVPWLHELTTGAPFYPDPLTGRLPRHADGTGFEKKHMLDLPRLQWVTPLGEAYAITGDERYSRAAVKILDDFFAFVPPRHGIPWAVAMDIGIRAANLVLLWQFLRLSPSLSDAFVVRFWKSLTQHIQACVEDAEDWPIEPPHPMAELPHIRAVRRRGKIFRLYTNHYLGGRVGVWVSLNALPPTPATADLKKTVAADLEREILHQTLPEGMNFEASTQYHRLVGEMFFAWAMVNRNAGRKMSAAATERFRKIFEFARDITKPDGTIPQVGDMDNGRFFMLGKGCWRDHRYLTQLGACFFRDHSLLAPGTTPDRYALWHFGPAAVACTDARCRVKLPSAVYRRTGIAILRSGPAYASFTALKNGQDGAGGHSHADKLAVEYSLGNRNILVDPGQGCYMTDFNLRKLFRSALSHSVLNIDGADVNPICPGNPWFVPDVARARLTSYNRARNQVTGEHAGFVEATGGRYRRTVRLGTDGALHIDEKVAGSGIHRLEWRFVLAPGLAARLKRGAKPHIAIADEKGLVAQLTYSAAPNWRVSFDTANYAWEYGRWSPTSVIVLSLRVRLPFAGAASVTPGCSAWRQASMPAGDSGWAGAEARPHIRTPCHPS